MDEKEMRRAFLAFRSFIMSGETETAFAMFKTKEKEISRLRKTIEDIKRETATSREAEKSITL